MNAQTSMTRSVRSAAPSRAALSPLSRVASFAAKRPSARRTALRASSAPAAPSLTPASPALEGPWFDPHLFDHLQLPLSRIRE